MVEPAVPDGRRQSLPGNGTGFLDMNDESYQRAMDLREKEHGIREIDAATNLHRSEARALAMAIIERAEHVSKGAIDGTLHPTAYAENRCFSTYLEEGCYFVGHLNTDLDSRVTLHSGSRRSNHFRHGVCV